MSLKNLIIFYGLIFVSIALKPDCQYAIDQSYQVFPLGACNYAPVQFAQHYNMSYTYMCNKEKNGLELLTWFNIDCSGDKYDIDNGTGDFMEFDCSLPECNDNDNALLTIEIQQPPYDGYIEYDNFKMNDCIPIVQNGQTTGSTNHICGISKEGKAFYEWTDYLKDDCSGIAKTSCIYYNGGNYINNTNTVCPDQYNQIVKCTKPSNISTV